MSKFIVVGVNSGGPGGDLATAPGVVHKTYFNGVPAGTVLPPAPPTVQRILERAQHDLELYGRYYDALNFEGVLSLP